MQDAVFSTQADLLLLFSSPLVSSGPLAALAFRPQDATLRRMWSHCEAVLDRQPTVRPCVGPRLWAQFHSNRAPSNADHFCTLRNLRVSMNKG